LSQPSDHAAERRRHLTGYALAAGAAVLWATGAVTAKWMFSRLSFAVEPMALSGARALLAFVATLAYLLVFDRSQLKVRPRDLWFLAAFGILGLAMVHFTYFQTISLTNVATAILLEYLAPILVLIVSVLFLGEVLTWTLPVGVALSILGAALVVGAVGGPGLVMSPAGIAWGLSSAFFFALYTLLGKYATPRWSPWTLLVYGLGFATIFWMLAMRGPAQVVAIVSQPVGLLAVGYVAIFSTVLPFGAFLYALRYIDATKASVTATLEPAVAGIIAFLLLGESFSLTQLLGAAFVLGAIMVVQLPSLIGTRRPGADAETLAAAALIEEEDSLPPPS
jgi:drug/metabolite transporter (DMT)-like permease